MEHELVGREEPLELLEGFIDGVAAHGGRLVIEGEAGIGKTTVWRHTVDYAARRGYRLLAYRASESEATLAYAGLSDLLSDVESSVLDVLPGPQRQALEVALLRADAAGDLSIDARAVFAAATATLRALAQDVPVLIAVDDRHWLDASSQKALDYLARRLEDAPVGLLSTSRPDGKLTRGEMILTLGPLSAAALHHLVKDRAQLNLTRPAALRLHRLTGGNPFYALEVAAVLTSAGMPGLGEVWPIPGDLRELTTERLALLPAQVRHALLVAAAAGHAAISTLDPKAVAVAERTRIVTVHDDGRVRFAHPLFAAAIYEQASAGERQQVHKLLAAQSDEIEVQARHLALAASGCHDEEVAMLLSRAAAEARGRGAPDVAAELEERAVALTDPALLELAWERELRAITDHFHAGDLELARALLLALLERPAPQLDRSGALLVLGETCYRLGLVADASRHLREAVDAAAGDARATIKAELASAFVSFSADWLLDAAGAAAQRALALAHELGDDALLACALAAVVHSDQLLGHGLDEERLERALAREDVNQPSPVERRPSLLAGLVLYRDEQFDRARATLETLRVRLVAAGAESDLPYVLTVLAMVECSAGNLLAAAERADLAYDLALQAGSLGEASLAEGVRALVQAQLGRADEARAAAAAAFELVARSGWQVADFWARVAIGQLELSLGNWSAVVATLSGSLGQVEKKGVVDANRRPLPDAIEALIQLGEVERADRLTLLLERRAQELEQGAASLAAARCRALVQAARGELAGALDGLEQALAEPDVREPLTFARALIVKGQLERRRKRKRQAAQSLREALQICERIGTTLWAARAAAELERLGRVDDPDELTATEARVARLAASGLTNREVATAAFMSQKTVEANMSRIFRKLGIRSRSQLATRLAARERTGDEAVDVDTQLFGASTSPVEQDGSGD